MQLWSARVLAAFRSVGVRASLLTLLILGGIELLSGALFRLPTLTGLLAVVAYITFLYGLQAGLVSTLITSLYGFYYFSTPGQLFTYTSENLLRLLIFPVSTITIVVMVGVLQRSARAAEVAVRESEARFRRLTDATFEGIVIHDAGTILECNQAFATLFGYSVPELIGHSIFDLVTPATREVVRDFVHLNRDQSYTATGVRQDGSTCTLEVQGRPLAYQGRTVRVAALRDITDQQRAEEARILLGLIVESSDDAIMSMTLAGTIMTWNRGAERLFGYTQGDIVGTSIARLVPPDWPDDTPQMLAALHAGHSGEQHETLRLTQDGQRIDVVLTVSPIRDATDAITGASIIARDITQRKRTQEILTYQAFHDLLTGLPNRALFLDRLQHALAPALRQQSALAVLFFDLDRFKQVNDSLGHAAGDQLLVAVAKRLQTVLRPSDTGARLGGDEFAILLENLQGVEPAIAVAERILSQLQAPFTLRDQTVIVNASIGIAFSPTGVERADDLLRFADEAMYSAKRTGKGRYELYTGQVDAPLSTRFELEAALRRAVKQHEFVLHYQPKLQLAEDRIEGWEALVRWQHPTRGLLLPGAFLPLAEESGLILPLGRWVLEEACRQLVRWQLQFPSDPPQAMCVNLSTKQFQRSDLIETVSGVLQATGLAPACLVLEITEGVIIEDTEPNIATLHKLKALGVRLAIDDFGAGYTSLRYLRRLPLDILKIDKSFIAGIPHDPNDTAIVESLIRLTQAVGLTVVAEGVEQAAQLAHLQALGCDFVQGFFVARPMPADVAETFIHSAHS